MLTNKYDDPKAVEMRNELRKLQDTFEELKYKMTLVAKEAEEKQKAYLEYLGVLPKEEEKKESEVK